MGKWFWLLLFGFWFLVGSRVSLVWLISGHIGCNTWTYIFGQEVDRVIDRVIDRVGGGVISVFISLGEAIFPMNI